MPSLDSPLNSSPAQTPRAVFWLMLLSVAFLSANMRAPIVVLGAIAPVIQKALGISEAHIGWLGAIPMLMFALAAFVSPKIGKRFGNGNTLIMALVVLIVGIILRSVWTSWTGFLVGTVLLSLAIGFANTLVAPLIKERTPKNIALLTAVYSLSMALAAGVASGIVLPLAKVVGWQWALGGWAGLSVIALLIWLVLRFVAVKSDKVVKHAGVTQASQSSEHTVHQLNRSAAPAPPVSIWRSPVAWQLAMFLGLQSLLYYTIASFLPSIVVAKGLTQIQGGSIGSIFQFVAPLVIVVMTLLIRRGISIQTVAIALALFNAVGIFGIAYLPVNLAWLWSACMGIACTGIFTLTIMLFSLRTYTPHQASQLSGMVQTIAYLIAFLGPFGAGWLHELTHGWEMPLLLILVLTALNVIIAWFVSRPIMIDGQPV